MRTVLGVCLLAVVSCGGAWAQAAGFGSVSGTIRDASGDGIPDTSVLLSNQALGIKRTMVTTDDGLFDAPALVPAPGYSIQVTRKGFKSWEFKDFEVSLGQNMNFAVTLENDTGSGQSETVSGPALGELRTGVALPVDRLQNEALPTSDRRLDALVLLSPTLSTSSTTGQMVFRGEPSFNSFLTDGIDTTNGYWAERPGIANQLSRDAVDGFQVLFADTPAEFGRAMGGVVNAATRSGSNNFHGSAYGYFRLSSLAATPRYALGQSLLQGRKQEGASVGGPILENKVFFFANFEASNGNAQGLNRITSPLIADPYGRYVLPSNCKATTAQCAAATKFIQSQMNVLVPFDDHWVTGLAKLDYRRSDRNSFSVEGNAMNLRAPMGSQVSDVAANGGMLGIGNSKEQTVYGRAGWTSAPTRKTLNELRVGLFQDRLFDPASQAGLSTGNLGITVAGVTVGAAHPHTSQINERRYQLIDNLTVNSGSHTLQVGADMSRTRDNINSLPNAGGTYTYPSLTAFAQDFSGGTLKSYTTFTQQVDGPVRTVPFREINLYAQDTWRVTRNLTVIAGVRWDRPHLPQPSVTNTSYYQTASVSSPNIDFSPRVGLAYVMDDRTVVRLGYSFFYAPFPGALLDTLILGNGLYETNIVVNPGQTNAPVFPKVIPAFSAIPAGSADVLYSVSKLRNPHTQQASLAVERRLNKDTTLTVNVMNNRGLKLWTVSDLNLATPTKTEIYTIDNAAGQATGTYTTSVWTAKNDPNHARVYQVDNTGTSWYNAAAVEVRRRMSHGLTAQASYTWSHALDDVGGPQLLPFLPAASYPGNYSLDKGNSATDQRHRVAANWIWQPTLVKSTTPAARWLLNGWELSGIATLASSLPATELVMVNGQQFSGITMVYANALNGAGGWARVPFIPVNSLRAQPQYTVDARISRTLPFTERIKGVVLLEGFNLFNTQHNTGVYTVGYTATTTLPAGAVSGPTSGVLRPVAGLGVGNASQGFPDGTTARRCQVAFRLVF